MAKRKLIKRTGACTKHSKERLLRHCGFKGNEAQARRFITLCRKMAGRNGPIVISSKNLGVSKREMHGIKDDRYTITFFNGKAPTVLQLCD